MFRFLTSALATTTVHARLAMLETESNVNRFVQTVVSMVTAHTVLGHRGVSVHAILDGRASTAIHASTTMSALATQRARREITVLCASVTMATPRAPVALASRRA